MEFWIGFNAFILAMLVFDLGFVNRKPKPVGFKESIGWVAFWAALAFSFAALVHHWAGADKAFEFLTGYVIEWSLSVDNLFVFLVIFSFFDVPRQHQHKVLFYGIMGALVLRGVFIYFGVKLFASVDWISYVFGAILLFTGYKMLTQHDEQHDLEKNFIVRWTRKFLPVTAEYHGGKFIVRKEARTFFTPLFIVLVTVEFTDLVFAVDSIPAVLSVSSDPFIVYTSNVFAILGLRALFFALSGMMEVFRFLKYGLAVILSFVGVKMVLSHHIHVPVEWALFVIVFILAVSILFSLVSRKS
jgi:tellurite resistance protein TerC